MAERTQSAPSSPGQAGSSPADLLPGFAEVIPVPVVLLTADGRIRHANAAFVQTLGIEGEHYLHRQFPRRWLMDPQEALPQLRELLHYAAQPGVDPRAIQLPLRAADGSEIHAEIHARPWPSPDQGPDSLMVVTFKDTACPRPRTETDRSEASTDPKPLRDEVDGPEKGCRILFQHAPTAHALYDMDGRFVDGNQSATELMGYRREELIGMNLLELSLLPQHERPKAAQVLAESAAGRPTGPDEFTLTRRDGSTVPVEVNTYPATIQDRPLVLAMARDITERRQVEEQLRRSEERFAIMADSAQDAILMMDPQGHITFYNKTAQAMFGWTATEALGKDLHTLISPQMHHEAYHKGLAHFRCTGQGPAIGRTLELTALRKDGTEFPIEISLAGVELDQQWHAIGIVRDIAERRQAEEAILKEKAFSDSVINTLPGVFYMFNEEGKYVWWNKNLEDVTEYSSDEIPNVHPTELFGEAERERIRQAMATVFQEGSVTVEADLLSKSGRKTPYFFTGVRVERNGKPYLIGLGIDITERRKAQVALEKLNADLESSVHELERSNRELQDFAHIAAHDLKAPLRGIATVADWLDQDYGEQIGPEGRENLHLLQGRVDRMGRLVSGILRYSEIGHSDQPIEMLDTHALVEEVIEQIAPPDHVEIRIKSTLPSVPAERTRLTQVFQNLISNAVKYIDKDRGKIQIGARDDGNAWEFRICDNGPGIEAKHFARIFQMFQTLSPSDRCESTGLGLAVVKKIVGIYGGRVWLESAIGQGSAFFFTVPKHQKHVTRERD